MRPDTALCEFFSKKYYKELSDFYSRIRALGDYLKEHELFQRALKDYALAGVIISNTRARVLDEFLDKIDTVQKGYCVSIIEKAQSLGAPAYESLQARMQVMNNCPEPSGVSPLRHQFPDIFSWFQEEARERILSPLFKDFYNFVQLYKKTTKDLDEDIESVLYVNVYLNAVSKIRSLTYAFCVMFGYIAYEEDTLMDIIQAIIDRGVKNDRDI